jgi:hypothetical protein
MIADKAGRQTSTGTQRIEARNKKRGAFMLGDVVHMEIVPEEQRRDEESVTRQIRQLGYI